MAIRITALPEADTSVSLDAVIPVVDGTSTKKIALSDLPQSDADRAAITALSTSLATKVDGPRSDLLNRTNHLGEDPAANVRIALNNLTLEQWVASVETRLAGTTPSAPTIDTAPTIAGTKTVGQTLTATPGTVTEGTGGSHTNEWQWYKTDASSNTTPIDGATAITLVLVSTLLGYRISVSQVAVDSTGLKSAAVTSAVTTAVTGTTPTNTVAPSISPSGTQAPGNTVTVSAGTWNDMTSGQYGFQIVVGGVNVGTRVFQAGTTYDYIITNQDAGKTLTANVIGQSSLGVQSAAVASSNSITVSGTNSVVNTAAPAWGAATIYVDVQDDFTEGTWTGTINATRTWDFYRNGIEPANLYRSGNTLSLHTPRSSEGVVAGDTLYIKETVTETATGLTQSVFSAGKVVQAVPATLAATTVNTGMQWTAGSAITNIAPVQATGGTPPYTYTTPGLPTGLSQNALSGIISGTPASPVSLTTYTTTVTDAVGATDSDTWTATVAAASTSTLSALAYADASVAISGANTSYNGTTAKVYSNQVVLGPNGDQRNIHRLIQGAPSISGGVRNELLWFGAKLQPGAGHWLYMDFLFGSEFPATSVSDDTFLSFQTHYAGYGDTQPDLACFVTRQGGTPLIRWRVSGNANNPGNYADNGGSGTNNWQTTGYNSAYFGSQTLVQNSRHRFIVFYRPGWLASHNPRIDIWVRNGSATTWTQLVTNYTNYPTMYNYNGATQYQSYFRIGGYKWTSSTWNNSPISWISTPLYLGYGDNLYNEAVATSNSLAA